MKVNMRHGLTGVGICLLTGCTTQSRVLDTLPTAYHLRYKPKATVIAPPLSHEAPVNPSAVAVASTVNVVTAEAVSADPWAPIRPLSSRWSCVVIHHSDSETGSQRDIDQSHRGQSCENGCGYHVVIGNGTGSADGAIEPSRRWLMQIEGAHTRLEPAFAARKGLDFQHYNQHGIGIALVGDFEHRSPSPAQKRALTRPLAYLVDQCGIPANAIHGHGEVDQTACPGRNCGLTEIRQSLRLSE